MSPEYQIVYPDTQAMITCTGEIGNVHWEREGVEMDSKKEWGGPNQQIAILTFPRTHPEHEGNYECIGSGGNPFKSTAQLHIAGN